MPKTGHLSVTASPSRGGSTSISLPCAGVATQFPTRGPYSNFFSLPCVRGGVSAADGGVVL